MDVHKRNKSHHKYGINLQVKNIGVKVEKHKDLVEDLLRLKRNVLSSLIVTKEILIT